MMQRKGGRDSLKLFDRPPPRCREDRRQVEYPQGLCWVNTNPELWSHCSRQKLVRLIPRWSRLAA